ncbi:MAG: DUF1178 family protein [Betaproteobacteria bacterium]|nr:DUF1178 family protein [Betaproteobacteria bacterium]
MIVYDLKCQAGHRFEGWFSSAEEFAGQKARGLLSCPSCADSEIERMPSATRINVGATEKPQLPATTESKDAFALAQMLYSRMLDELLTKSEDVGNRFPEEARRIYYEEIPVRAIRGVATQAEHNDLVEEGIPVARLPIPPGDQLN